MYRWARRGKSPVLGSAEISSRLCHQHAIRRNFATSSSSNDRLDQIYLLLRENELQEAAHQLNKHFQENEGSGPDSPSYDELVSIVNFLKNSPHQAEKFLKRVHESSAGENCCRLNLNHCIGALKGWRDFHPPSAKRAQAFLDYMDRIGINYHTESCNLVIQTWAKMKNAEGAQALFDKMIQKDIKADVSTFSHVLEAWSKSKSPLAPKKADAALNLMRKLKIDPTIKCFIHVIECWSKSGRKFSEERISDLYQEVWRCFENNEDCNPKLVQNAMLSVLQAFHNISNAHRAEDFLLKFAGEYRKSQSVPPTLDMCISVLSTWSKSKSSRRAARAEKLLSLMEKGIGLPPPDVTCYTAVLHCWASSNKENAAKRAELLLRLMECNKDTPPNLVSYTCVLNAWSRSKQKDAPIHAERIFRETQERGVSPDRLVYAALISAWGRSDTDQSAIKAENWLRQLKRISASNPDECNFQPTVVEYTATIQAWANYIPKHVDKSREAISRVEALLDEMLTANEPKLKPNSLTYAAVLKSISAARRLPDRGERADSVLRVMRTEGVEATPFILGLSKKCKARETKQANKKNLNFKVAS